MTRIERVAKAEAEMVAGCKGEAERICLELICGCDRIRATDLSENAKAFSLLSKIYDGNPRLTHSVKVQQLYALTQALVQSTSILAAKVEQFQELTRLNKKKCDED